MNWEETKLKGVYIINNFNVNDDRGLFVKTFNKQQFLDKKINFAIRESYYSVSKLNVIRGMHFQLPPHSHEKLVYVAKGKIIDVVLDLRKISSTYLQYISVELSEENRKSIFIPKGLAHGFKSLEDDSITIYNVGTEYNSKFDAGIKYDTIGFDWEIDMPILSARDSEFISLNEFNNNNPF